MQTTLILSPRGQQILDELLGLDRSTRYRTPPAASCPFCGRCWRSAPWISRVRARRHTLTKHGVLVADFQLAAPAREGR